jgi:squalene-associated FAD-dependent desaturase
LDIEDPDLDQRTFGEWLAVHGQRPRAIDGFWNLIARPTLNLPAEGASLALAAKVFQTGFLSDAGAGDIGWAAVPLDEVHARPAADALAKAGGEVVLRARVRSLHQAGVDTWTVQAGEAPLDANAVIVAVPHDEAAELLPSGSLPAGHDVRKLGASPIVDLHVVYDRTVTDHKLAAGVWSPVQFVFDRTAASGLERGQYLVISLSAADEHIDTPADKLRARFLPEMERLFPRARAASVERFFVTREPHATFRQAPGTRSMRPGPVAELPGLYLAGAWTDTGWPATMEGAVRSGRAAARAALAAGGVQAPTEAVA